jgi:dimethylhistidine N-methyltransferase
MSTINKVLRATDAVSGLDDEFAAGVIEGLSRPHKSLPCRFFYDARGSELFEQITGLPEYYPTRTEVAILESQMSNIVADICDGAVLVEFGSGSSRKTEILLSSLPGLRAYVPIDVSASALNDAKQRLLERFPSLDIRLVIGDFSNPVAFPSDLTDAPKTGFFPGSTIGNLNAVAAGRLLSTVREVLSPGGRLIVGVDLKKDARKLVCAYNDAAGVTAAFNLNLLARINRELEGSFDLDGFRHKAIYDPREGRVEMHLVSVRDQMVSVLDQWFKFFAGETIHTENSYKYSVHQFQELARSAGWNPAQVWIDEDNLFSVHELISGSRP